MIFMSQNAGKASAATRSEIPEEFKWNLNDLFPSVEGWKKEKQNFLAGLKDISSLRGTLSASSDQLLRVLDLYFKTDKAYARISAYASMLSDQDTRQPEPLSMKQEMVNLRTKFAGSASFIEPEVLAMPADTLNSFVNKNRDLDVYRQYLDDVSRRRGHTLAEAEEKLIAEAGLMADTAEESYSILSNADLPYRTVKLVSGEEVRIDPTAYALHRASPNREDRIIVFDAFFSALKGFERTFGTQLYGEIKKNLFFRNARRYSNCLESALFGNNIPVDVYLNLIASINSSLPVLHKYLGLRKKLLGLDQLSYHDLNTSMVKDVDILFNYEEAKSAILNALGRLGEDYINVIRQALTEHWIDVLPNLGKRSGAYMSGQAYDVHPYILTNFNGRYDDVSTLSHELGHAVHSSFSNRYQPYVNSRYPIFLAEVASTVNEALLMDYELQRLDDRLTKISLLGGYLENFRTTLFRQTQFAEFELRTHELAEKGEALTGERFTSIYTDILKKYYGHDKGVCFINDLYGIEWAYIPHFYMNFYVFQYGTSFIASQAIAAKILNGEEETVKRYLNFLKSGSSDYAIPTLRKVGIDMLSKEPFELAMKRMNQIIEIIESLERQ